MPGDNEGDGGPAVDVSGGLGEGWVTEVPGQAEREMGRLREQMEGLEEDMREVESELHELEASISRSIEDMLGCDSTKETNASKNRIRSIREQKRERERILLDMRAAAEAYVSQVADEERRMQRMVATGKIMTLNRAVGDSLKKMRKEQEKVERLGKEVEEMEEAQAVDETRERREGLGVERVWEMMDGARKAKQRGESGKVAGKATKKGAAGKMEARERVCQQRKDLGL